MSKKRLILTLVLTLCTVMYFANCVSATTYTDTEHWAKNYIDYVTEQEYFYGTSDATFSPDANMTRGMFVTVLARYAKTDLSQYKLSPFEDIVEQKYYTKPVLWAYKNNIVEGIDETHFSPDSSLTREQAATILYRYLDLKCSNTVPNYKDWNEVSDWAKDAVATLSDKELFVGSNGSFNPKNNITRAEVSVLFSRLDGKTFDIYEAPVKEHKPKMTYIGNFKNTFYCTGYCCNGRWAGVTATDAKPAVGTTIAVDPRVIPLGSKVYLEFQNKNCKELNGYYIAQDTGGAIKGYRIDVLVGSHSEAYQYGVGTVKVYIVKE